MILSNILKLRYRTPFHSRAYQPLAQRRCFCVETSSFEVLAEKELAEINDFVENKAEIFGVDNIDFQEGVLSIEIAGSTIVINKHSASQQIWYSSPVPPPAYFDPVNEGHKWWSNKICMNLRSRLISDMKRISRVDVSD